MPATVCSHRDTEQKRVKEKEVPCSKSVLSVLWGSPGQSFCPLCPFPSKCSRVADGVGSGEKKGAFTTSQQPVLPSVVHDTVNQTSFHCGHFFLPDFSERFPPRSDFSDRSPFSRSFSISFSFSLSALSMRSARSERSPPFSDLLSNLLPSRRVPSSVEEVVGWGWPRLAISSCSEILVVMLFTHAFRSSYLITVITIVSNSISILLIDIQQSLWGRRQHQAYG